VSSVRTRRQDAGPVVVIGAGQSGLAAVRALLDHDLEPLVLEAGNRAAGSWPCYYDSLMAFSPAGFSSLRGMSFPGHSDHYPARDEVASYLERYAARLGVDIITRSRVVTVGRRGRGFVVITADGSQFLAAGVVAASGSFSSPHRPASPDRRPSKARCCMWPITATRRPTRGSG
jgi:putative flavoprotein involved in K+ transport